MADHIIRRQVPVGMRDGVQLATDVWLPAEGGPFPTLLQRTPYGRGFASGTQTNAGMENLRALEAGFAVVIQDTRGRFDSEGDFEPFAHEADDGVDALAWIRDQPFSDGRVATYGASYVGVTQLLLAQQGPEGHVAMAPFLTAGRIRDGWLRRGGALQLGFLWLWLIEGLGPPDADHRALGVDHPGRRWLAEAATDPGEAMRRLPLLTQDALEAAPYLERWLAGGPDGDRWASVEPTIGVARVRARGLHIVGLNDLFAEGSLQTYRELREGGATSAVRDGQWLVLGPWAHGNLGDWQGDGWLGRDASVDSLDLPGLQLDFFRAAMEGRDPDLPRVTYFVTGENAWHEADAWPPPGRDVVLHLATDGRLSTDPLRDPGVLRYLADPDDPVPTVGGQTYLPGVQLGKNSGPKDQREVEARADVLVLRGEPLGEALTVAGPVRLELWAQSSAQDCDWTGRLVDVDPPGCSLGIADGILRSRHRHGDAREALVPGEAECFVIDLGHVSHRFAAGHRIGLQVASSNFPRFDRNPQTLVEPHLARPQDFVIAEQTVHVGADRASRLLLPVLDLVAETVHETLHETRAT